MTDALYVTFSGRAFSFISFPNMFLTLSSEAGLTTFFKMQTRGIAALFELFS